MSAPKHGGQAFPMVSDRFKVANCGMTLRQWYKGQVLRLVDTRYTQCGNESACAYETARYAGILADAMIEEDESFAQRNGEAKS